MEDSEESCKRETNFAGDKSTFDFTKQSWRDDVTFLVDDKRLYASKSVLAIFSPVFESMFGTSFKENTENEVALPGKKAEDFLEFLHCIYPSSNRTVTRETVFQVLPLADEYQVGPLLEKCNEVLKKHEFGINDLLKCYILARRHNLSKVNLICVEKILNVDHFVNISSEADKIMDKETFLKLTADVITEQAKRINDVTTKFVKLSLRSAKIDTSGFENAIGTIIEHTIENVFDPTFRYDVNSKSARLWDVFFKVQISVDNKQLHSDHYEKYLSVHLHCNLPDDKLSCEVKAIISLENVAEGDNKIITTRSFSKEYKNPDSRSYGYKHFERLSTFLSGTSEAIEINTRKLVVYVLAKQPTPKVNSNLLLYHQLQGVCVSGNIR